MSTTKMPAFQFYPSDWLSDLAVNALTYEQQGMWFHILCLMHESSDRGKMTLNGKAMSDESIARVLGVDNKLGRSLIATLLDKGVASRCEETGALMNRRMVRDEGDRLTQKEYGKLGGNPKLCAGYNKPGFLYAAQRLSDGAVKIGISEQPSKRLYRIRYQQREPVELLAVMRVDDMGTAEAAMHQKYSHRASGEWFALTDSERSALLFTLKGKLKANETPSYEDEDISSQKKVRVPAQTESQPSQEWLAFRTHAEACGVSGSEPDWTEAQDEWSQRLTFADRLAASQGLTARKGTEDPALRSLPQNYLRKRMWQRAIHNRKGLSAGSEPLGPYRPKSWTGTYPEACSGKLRRSNGHAS